MPYTKPHTFTDSTTLDATGLNSNDKTLREYVNEGVVENDIADGSIGTEELQRGDYDPITNQYVFTTGIAAGESQDINFNNRAYFTATTKKSRQTSADLEHWQSLYGTAGSVYLEYNGDILITFGGTFISEENEVVSSHYWDSQVMLGYTLDDEKTVTLLEQTRAYTFEETIPTNTSLGTYSPFGGTSRPSDQGYEVNEISKGCRRWIGFTCLLQNMPPGFYKFAVYINAKVEQGYTSARSFKTEVFYK